MEERNPSGRIWIMFSTEKMPKSCSARRYIYFWQRSMWQWQKTIADENWGFGQIWFSSFHFTWSLKVGVAPLIWINIGFLDNSRQRKSQERETGYPDNLDKIETSAVNLNIKKQSDNVSVKWVIPVAQPNSSTWVNSFECPCYKMRWIQDD